MTNHDLIVMHHFLAVCIWAMFTSRFFFVSSSDLFASEANPVETLTMHDVMDLSFLDNSDASSSNPNNDNLFAFDPAISPTSSVGDDETNLFDQSATDPSANSPFPLADLSVNNCLSSVFKFQKIRMRSSAICTDSGLQQNAGELLLPSLSQQENSISSPAVAKAVDASVRKKWCSSTSVEGFGNIPVCNVGNSEEFDEDVENSEESALRAAGDAVDYAVIDQSPFRNILSGYLSGFYFPLILPSTT